jgi:hypothetical protein
MSCRTALSKSQIPQQIFSRIKKFAGHIWGFDLLSIYLWMYNRCSIIIGEISKEE